MRDSWWLPVLFICCGWFLTTVSADDFLGCGGYVQVDPKVGLDLSKVEIRLYTKQGNLKYNTDCAPNNGYYFVPVYEKGEYVVRLVAPTGWSFEPAAVPLTVDRLDDDAGFGDINFTFKGFAITGKVSSLGHSEGPAGVTVELRSQDEAPGRSVVTTSGGNFAFDQVPPGRHRLIASNPIWRMASDQVEVELVSDSMDVSRGLDVLGYDVRGRVTSDGEPIQGVLFSLYAPAAAAASGASGRHCGLEAPAADSAADVATLEGDWVRVCETASEPSGEFVLPVVGPGRYRLVPVYRGDQTQFDIRPSTVDLHVDHDSLVVREQFEVAGFRVSGRVVDGRAGPVVGARVFLDGRHVVTTSADGRFNLENVKTATYRLTAQAESMGFEELTVRISPNAPLLPDLVVSTYQVCGVVHLDQLPPAVAVRGRQVIFLPSAAVADAVPTLVAVDDATGAFCQPLPLGVYTLQPMLLESEVAAGLKFVPEKIELTVAYEPLSGFEFGQVRAVVSGRIDAVALDSAAGIAVQLTGAGRLSRDATTDADGAFRFDAVLPGRYTLRVLQDTWCWKSKSTELEVVDADVNDLVFQQLGFLLTASTSHDLQLELSRLNDGQEDETAEGLGLRLGLPAGVSRHCVEAAGRYVLTPHGRHHTFQPASLTWDTRRPAAVAVDFVATQTATGVAVRAPNAVTDLSITAISDDGEAAAVRFVETHEEAPDRWVHRFVFDGRVGATYRVSASTPKGDLLFFPAVASVDVAADAVADIVAQPGLYLTGHIRPAIADVQVTITSTSTSELWTVTTDADGAYSFGPVNSAGSAPADLSTAFDVAAVKAGYVFRREAKSDAEPGDFQGDFAAEKLAEIEVLVTDAATGQPLAGVLIAAAGGVGYRQNSVSGADGRVSLAALQPGDYFVKPVLKEYRFQPPSKLVHIDDGATVQLPITGERVAFSCYGAVTALNGEPEPSVTVEAQGVGDDCAHFLEEATTEANGQFRIRGLLPQCRYAVALKKSTDTGVAASAANRNIQRTLPANLIVQVEKADVTGLRLAAIKSINQADVMVSVGIDQLEHLRTLKLKLFRAENPDQVIHQVRLDQSALVLLPALAMDGRQYVVQLESTLGRTLFDSAAARATFTANASAQHVALQFRPRRRPADGSGSGADADVDAGVDVSVRAVVALLCVAAAIYHRNLLAPVLSAVFQKLLSSVATGGSRSGGFASSGAGGVGSRGEPVFTEQELELFADSNASGTGNAKKKLRARRT